MQDDRRTKIVKGGVKEISDEDLSTRKGDYAGA
jgi:hypothetical protein